MNTDIPSSADLTCFATENTLLLPHLKQVYNEFSRVSCDFSSCRFIFSLVESKTGCSKVGSIFIFNFFSLYQKIKTPEKHPGRVAQGHKLAALVKKRKEEILRNKERSTQQPTEQFTQQSTQESTVQSTQESTVQSNDTYVYDVGILAILAIGVCVFFTYNTFPKKQTNDCLAAQHEQKKDQPPKKRHMR